MKKKTENPQSGPVDGNEAITVSVAYNAGPPEIEYAGRYWRRGVVQPLTKDDYTAMRARTDFAQFEFSAVPAVNTAQTEE